MSTKAEGRKTLISNFLGRAKEAVKDTFESKGDDDNTVTGRLVERGVERGIASFEKKARAKLPDAGILAGAGLIILLLLGAIFYWAR